VYFVFIRLDDCEEVCAGPGQSRSLGLSLISRCVPRVSKTFPDLPNIPRRSKHAGTCCMMVLFDMNSDRSNCCSMSKTPCDAKCGQQRVMTKHCKRLKVDENGGFNFQPIPQEVSWTHLKGLCTRYGKIDIWNHQPSPTNIKSGDVRRLAVP
jgi:hypothetical protein